MQLFIFFVLHLFLLVLMPEVDNWTVFSISFLIWYILSHWFGLSIVYHKLFSHRSFVPKKGVAFAGVLLNVLSFKGGPQNYALTHRVHHAHADTDLDPHTPKDHWYIGYFGIFNSERVLKKFSNEEKRKIVFDLFRDFSWVEKITRHKQYLAIVVFYSMLWVLDSSIAVAILFASVVSIHTGLMINFLGHQKINNVMETVNSPILAFVFGPSFNHKYHHSNPGNYHEAGPEKFEIQSWVVKNFLSKSN
jgi:fatty-acid desaturase